MAELDAIKRERIGGLMIRRDWGDRAPWPTASGDLSEVSRAVKQIIRAAGLREELCFTSFSHGGHTEMGDGELTDAEIRAVRGHRREGSSALRQTDHEAGRRRGEEAAGDADGRRLTNQSGNRTN